MNQDKKNKYIYIAILCFGCFLLVQVIRAVRWQYGGFVYIEIRKAYLEEWHDMVSNYYEELHKMPENLYVASLYYPDDFWYPDISPEATPREELDRMLEDPNYFNENIEYELVNYSQGWLIIELKSDTHYPYQMLIDNKGRIYQVDKKYKNRGYEK
ncbi:MAG TPA: hypothetical protein PKB02_04625 [Anaerohalosphaeraceae bacterium]|nr:hypothetical protein [Anaerohalosphaeraceae bacterium]